jgi:LmbE family N-acetylglucosaminyl deacetylase
MTKRQQSRAGSAGVALAVVSHPDDIEFYSAGTLLLLREAGWAIHYLTLSGGGNITMVPSFNYFRGGLGQ